MSACAPSLSNRKSLSNESTEEMHHPVLRQFADLTGELIRRRTVGPFHLTETFHSRQTVLPKHAHRQAYVTFVLEGAFDEQYSDDSIACGAGGVRFLPAAELHENRVQAGSRCLHVGIEPAVLEQLHQRAIIPDKPAEINGLTTTWLAHRVSAEFSRHDSASAIAIEGLILETLAEISRSESQPGSADAPEWLRRATKIVESRFLERLSLGGIASEVGVHYVHLSRQFHKYNRCTVGDLIRKRRVQYACQLLARSQTPLAQIALVCGFSDQSHLSFLFKRYMGVSPSKFRTLAGPQSEPEPK